MSWNWYNNSDVLVRLPHVKHIFEQYKQRCYNNDFDYYSKIRITGFSAELIRYDILYNGEPYIRPKYKKYLYKLTNFLHLTDINNDYVKIDISDILNWKYYFNENFDATYPFDEYSLTRSNNDLSKNDFKFNFYFNNNVSFENNETADRILNIDNNGVITLYIRNINVDEKNCVIRYTVQFLHYIRQITPIENDIMQLGQTQLKAYLSDIKNYAKVEKLHNIFYNNAVYENGYPEYIGVPNITNNAYEVEQPYTSYAISTEEMVMLSDYALELYHFTIEDFYNMLYTKLEKAELQYETENYIKLFGETYNDIIKASDIDNVDNDESDINKKTKKSIKSDLKTKK